MSQANFNVQTKSEVQLKRQQILTILNAARQAPSGDNCQPWKFEIFEDSLLITMDEIRVRHAMNNNQHATLITLGVLLETISLEANRQSLSISFRLENLHHKEGIRAHVKFLSPSKASDPLANFLKDRHTDRSDFAKTFLLPEEKLDLLRMADNNNSCQLRVISQPTPQLLEYFVKTEDFLWTHPKVISDLLNWVRLKKNEIKNSKDGMTWQNLGARFFEWPLLFLFKQIPKLALWMSKSGLLIGVKLKSRKTYQNSGGFMSISITNNNPQLMIEAGRLLLRTWVYLNSKGYGVQPLSLASLTSFDYATGHEPEFAHAKYKKHFADGIEIMRKEFNFSHSHLPVWIFRFGKPLRERNSKLKTKRLELEDLILNTTHFRKN